MSQTVPDNNAAPTTTSTAPSQQLLREDQISNAVQFLAHPKVIGSPIETKRSFLERKGLSNEEIDEAFKRAPAQPIGIVPSTAPSSSNQGSGLVTYVPQPIQPTVVPAQQPTMHQPVSMPRPEPVRWTQVPSEGMRLNICGSISHGLFVE